MVKSNQNKMSSKKKGAKKAPPMRLLKQVVSRRGLDPPAAAYARLLADPCGAALAHPIYSGSEGGILVKAESVRTFGLGATVVNVGVHWTPGAIGSGNTEYLYAENNGDAIIPNPSAYTPGKAFLAANATGVRCVAACMQVTYLGTELNRAGTFTIGRTQGSLIDPLVTYSYAGIETALEHFTRTPDKTIELRWVPANMDQSFTDPNVATPTQERDRKSALTFLAQGLTATSGIRVRTVAIYEYQPLVGTGITTPSSARATSSFSLDDVLNYVQKATNVIGMVSSMYNQRTARIEL